MKHIDAVGSKRLLAVPRQKLDRLHETRQVGLWNAKKISTVRYRCDNDVSFRVEFERKKSDGIVISIYNSGGCCSGDDLADDAVFVHIHFTHNVKISLRGTRLRGTR